MAIKQIRFDSRRRTLFLALSLLLAAVVVAALMLQKGSTTKVYLVANRDLGAGTVITQGDVRKTELSLGSQAAQYLSAVPPGAVLSSPVLVGELIPRRAAVSTLPGAAKPLRITPSSPLSERIRVGSRVQLWFTAKTIGADTVTSAVQLLAAAEVLAIHPGESSMGRKIDDVELAVPTENLPAVITAIASSGFLSVVSES